MQKGMSQPDSFQYESTFAGSTSIVPSLAGGCTRPEVKLKDNSWKRLLQSNIGQTGGFLQGSVSEECIAVISCDILRKSLLQQARNHANCKAKCERECEDGTKKEKEYNMKRESEENILLNDIILKKEEQCF